MQIYPDIHPALRTKSAPVAPYQIGSLQSLFSEMHQTCIEADGVGLAAPQVGINLRFFIMCPAPNERYPDAPEIPWEVVINPRIIRQSIEMQSAFEGCLSIAGFRGSIARPLEIEVAYTNASHQQISGKLNGFLARVFLHEYDHLDGVLYPDRLAANDKLLTLEEWKNKKEEPAPANLSDPRHLD